MAPVASTIVHLANLLNLHTHMHTCTHSLDHNVDNIAMCEHGIVIGDGEGQLSEFPTAAMDSQRPYAFGLDPVSVATVTVYSSYWWSLLIDLASGREQAGVH